MKAALLVARRELSVTIRRKSYILMVFGMPIFFGIIIAISGYFAAKTAMKTIASAVALVDSSGVLDTGMLHAMGESGRERESEDPLAFMIEERLSQIPESTLDLAHDQIHGLSGAVTLFVMTDADSAIEAARRGDMDAALVVSGDYLETGKVWGYGKAENLFNEDEESPAERHLRRALVRSLMNQHDLDLVVQDRILRPMNLTEFELRMAGETAGEFEEKGAGSAIRSFALPYAFSLLMLMAIFMSSGFLLQGVAEEKENRVIETLLSTVTPDDLMMGKVLGLGVAGLLQMMVWLGMVLSLLTFARTQWIPDFDIPIVLFGQALVYFLLGYFMFASLMAGAGSLGNTQKESQQLSTVFTMPAILPMILIMAIMGEPNGVVARVLSYIPLTTPVTMMMRLPTEQVPWWEFPVTVVLLAVSMWVALKLGAKLFRLGSLMYGKRPSVPEIWRWLREA